MSVATEDCCSGTDRHEIRGPDGTEGPVARNRKNRYVQVARSLLTYSGVARRSRWKASRLEAYQQQRLEDCLRFASSTVAFHRARCPNDYRAIENWPATSRRDLQTTPVDRLLADGLDPKDCHVLKTSGSTGEPLQVFYSTGDLRKRWLHFQRMFRAYGMPLFFRLAQVHYYPGSQIFDPSTGWSLDQRSRLSVYEPVDRRIELMCRARPQAIMGYSTDLAEMATRAWERGLNFPDLKLAVGVGEMMDVDMRAAIARGFAVKVKDSYGAVEAGNIAFECPNSRGLYHLQSDNLMVEILDGGKPVSSGTLGEVVITHLNYRAMPLVRYRLGDLAATGPSCPCGSGFPTLLRLQGRQDDTITTSSGRRLSPQAVNCVFCGHEGVGKYRLRQHRKGVFSLEVEVLNEEMASRAGGLLRRILDPCDQLTVHYCSPTPSKGEGRLKNIVVEEE